MCPVEFVERLLVIQQVCMYTGAVAKSVSRVRLLCDVCYCRGEYAVGLYWHAECSRAVLRATEAQPRAKQARCSVSSCHNARQSFQARQELSRRA